MCIYLGNQDNLTYMGKEHIFPAAIGGISTLEKGCVSDQANSVFCKLEDELIHASTVSLCRGFSGPGKRGSNKPTGTVRVIYNNSNNRPIKQGLGILSMGKVNYIPHISIFRNSFSFSDEHSTEKELMESYYRFIKSLSKFNKNSRFINITPEDYSEDNILIGYHNHRWYVVCKETERMQYRIETLLKSKGTVEGISYNTLQPSLNDKILESENSDRVYGKIAFNVLCKIYGIYFVNHHNFDEFRDWVINGDANNSNWINEHICQISDLSIHFPKEAHWCLFSRNQNKVCAIVCLYNILTRKYILGEIPHEYSFNKLNGYICDWKNRIEYTFL